jgi:putative ABC transport system permease protein
MFIAALIFYTNISSRKYEFGVLRALGHSKLEILVMILIKAFILGVFGAVIGFFAGYYIADSFGQNIFKFTAKNIKPEWILLFYNLLIAPVFLLIASWIPAVIAVQIDPAEVLKEE